MDISPTTEHPIKPGYGSQVKRLSIATEGGGWCSVELCTDLLLVNFSKTLETKNRWSVAVDLPEGPNRRDNAGRGGAIVISRKIGKIYFRVQISFFVLNV